MSAQHDPGLHVVARVRGVRERDSRLGLLLGEGRELPGRGPGGEVTSLEVPATGTLATFTAHSEALAAAR